MLYLSSQSCKDHEGSCKGPQSALVSVKSMAHAKVTDLLTVVKVMVCSTQARRTFSVAETFSVPKTRLSWLSHLPGGHWLEELCASMALAGNSLALYGQLKPAVLSWRTPEREPISLSGGHVPSPVWSTIQGQNP